MLNLLQLSLSLDDMLTVSKIIIAQSFEPSLRGLKDLIVGLPQIDTK